MAVGGDVTITPPFTDQASRSNNAKSKNNVMSGFGAFKIDAPLFFNNSSAIPRSDDKKRIGSLPRRNTTTTLARSELAQQSDVPCAIDDINRAKQRLDASARDGDPWVLITCDDQGRATGLSNSCNEDFIRQVEHAFASQASVLDSHFNSRLAISGSGLASRNNNNVDLFSGQSSRRTSQTVAQGGFKREPTPINRIGKRNAAAFDDHRSLSPGEADQQCNVVPNIALAIGIEDTITTFYTTTFKAIQQQALKQILKAWIKELEPHKQKHHPYKGGVLPPYWPKQIPFVEPDHQRTEDRIAVAINILQFVQRDPKWSYDGVDPLESSTRNIKLHFDEEPQEKRGKRQILLQQLYEVARQQGLWLRGEKDGEDLVSVSDPMETMRVKRQPRSKRQKTTRTDSQSCDVETPSTSNVNSPESTGGSHFIASPSNAATMNATPLTDYSPTFVTQFHSEPEQSLPAHRQTNVQNGWSASGYNNEGHINNSIPYGSPGLPQQTFPFGLSAYSSASGQPSGSVLRSASFDSSTTGMEPMQLHYSNQAHSPTQLDFQAASHGLPDMTIGGIPITDVKMTSQTTTVYPVWTDQEQRWESTPGGYQTSNYPPSNDQLGHSF